MRWCSNCHNFNAGWPFRCFYCGAGLDGRLCPSGHVNPPDANLNFCGTCGRQLEPKWGSGGSPIPYALGFSVMLLTIVLAWFTWWLMSPSEPMLNALVMLAILAIGFRFAFSLVPPWLRNLTFDVLSACLSLIGSLLRVIFGTGIKGGGKK